MATIKHGSPLIGASGRLGNVVTYELNGVQVVRSLPFTKKRKPTKLQESHRQSFQMLHLLAQGVKSQIINRIWKKSSYQGGMNAYNSFLKANRGAFGQSDHVEFPELMVISQGRLNPVYNVSVASEDDQLLFTWLPGETGVCASGTDRLNLVFLIDRSMLIVMETAITRETGSTKVPNLINGRNITEGYLFWSSANDKEFSPSMYWHCV